MLVGVIAEEAFVKFVGDAWLAGLVVFGEGETGAVIRGVELVGVVEVEEALRGLAGGKGAVGFFDKEPAAGLGDLVPEGRQADVENTRRIADGAQKAEDGEHDRGVEREEGAAVVARGAAPKRPDIGGVGGADEPVLADHEQRAHPAEPKRLGPMQAGVAVGFHRATGVALALAGVAHAPAPKAEQGFARVPVKEAPGEAEKVSEPAEHSRTVVSEAGPAN